jgi:hypothetical protein
VKDGAVYVSYYDATNGDLKLAVRAKDATTWTTLRVDGQSADLGLYSSLALDADGVPGISYFQRGGNDDFDPSSCPAPAPSGDKKYITALKLAKATGPSPSSSADFAIKTLACQSRAAPACTGCTNVCADPGSGPGCYAANTTCTGCDPNTEVCITVGSAPTCAKKYNPSTLQEVVDGVGLFSSITFRGKDAFIAYMRRSANKGSLYGVRVDSAGAVGPRVLLDEGGDTGWFPDIKVDPAGKLAVSYHDFSSRKLKFYYADQLVAGLTPEVIDSGAGAPGSGDAAWVGTSSAIAFGPGGTFFVAYQDATTGDLKLAARKAGWEKLSAVRTQGAVGFFADAAFLGQQLFISHAQIQAKMRSGEPSVANRLLLDQYTAP